MTERSRRGVTRDKVSRVVPIKAPIKGWNARDPIEAMEDGDAITLDNFVVNPRGVALRRGHTEYVDLGSARVNSLIEYAAQNPSNRKFFAALGQDLYDITDPQSPTLALSSTGDSRWQHTMVATPAGLYLFMVNGLGSPRYFDGSSWAVPTITGVTASNLIGVCLHKSRLWFAELYSRKIWYLPPLEIGASSSAANALDLGAYFRLGGSVSAIGTWSRDGGDGSDDALVAVSSEGEVAVFTGTDPTSASTWALVGVYRIPPPIQYRCLVKAGADLAVLTVEGVVSLSETLPLPGGAQRQAAITNKISSAYGQAWRTGGDRPGWQIVEVPEENMVLVNAPIEDGRTDQFVMSTENGAWSRWTGIYASCVGTFRGRLYFGMWDGTVWQYREDSDLEDYLDIDEPITATLQTAFSSLGFGYEKRVTLVRTLMSGPREYIPKISVRVDYDRTAPVLSVVPVSASGTEWDAEDWDVASWSSAPQLNNRIVSASGMGTVISVALSVQSDVKLTFSRFDVVFEPSQGII